MIKTQVLIVGAGLAGLSTAYHLKRDYIIVEKDKRVGGLAKTNRVGEYLFDYTGHWMHFRYPHIKELISKVLDVALVKIQRKAKIYSNSVFIDFPFQANLKGLPSNIIKDCLLGFVKSHVKRKNEKRFKGGTFADYVEYYFGTGLGDNFFIPYNSKLWGVHLADITSQWCDRYIPKISLEDIIDGILGKESYQFGYNSTFYYPDQGGIGMIPEQIKSHIQNLSTNMKFLKVNTKNKIAYFQDCEIQYKYIVSTIPLKDLLEIIVDIPSSIKKRIPELKVAGLNYLNMGINRKVLKDYHWVYFPEDKFPFYRVGCPSNAVSYIAPGNKSTLCIELSNRLDVSGKELEIFKSVVEFLKKITDVRSKSDIDYFEFKRIPAAYVVIDSMHGKHTRSISPYLSKNNIFSIGRYGKWGYDSMEDALNDGCITAEILNGLE